MKLDCRFLTSIYALAVCVSVTLHGCRSTPVAPPEQTTEIPEVVLAKPGVPEELSPPPPSLPEIVRIPPPDATLRQLPESRIAKPLKDSAALRVEYNTLLHSRVSESSRKPSGWRYRATRQGDIVGFEFSNHGGNRILPPRRDASRNQFYTRDFQFRFDERARQDIHLLISDWVPSLDRTFRLSELMNSVMLFFPRSVLPAIATSQSRNIVTLSTGEEVEFDAATHEVVGGTLSESPVDLNPDRRARKFPGIQYNGNGVMIRADARGADPRIGATALITAAGASQNCDKGMDCARCQVPTKELWEQSGAARFKFATDADFDRFLLSRCGFGLPRIGAEYAIATRAR